MFFLTPGVRLPTGPRSRCGVSAGVAPAPGSGPVPLPLPHPCPPPTGGPPLTRPPRPCERRAEAPRTATGRGRSRRSGDARPDLTGRPVLGPRFGVRPHAGAAVRAVLGDAGRPPGDRGRHRALRARRRLRQRTLHTPAQADGRPPRRGPGPVGGDGRPRPRGGARRAARGGVRAARRRRHRRAGPFRPGVRRLRPALRRHRRPSALHVRRTGGRARPGRAAGHPRRQRALQRRARLVRALRAWACAAGTGAATAHRWC